MINVSEEKTRKKLEILKKKQDYILQVMASIYEKVTDKENVDKDITYENKSSFINDKIMEEKFPLNTVEDIEDIELFLEDDNNKAHIIQTLFRIGGRNAKDCTRLIMKKIIVDQLASQYSWLGHKKKRRFADLKISNVVLRTVSLHDFPDSEQQVIEVIKRWLAHAPERVSRNEKKTAEENEENMDIENMYNVDINVIPIEEMGESA